MGRGRRCMTGFVAGKPTEPGHGCWNTCRRVTTRSARWNGRSAWKSTVVRAHQQPPQAVARLATRYNKIARSYLAVACREPQ